MTREIFKTGMLYGQGWSISSTGSKPMRTIKSESNMEICSALPPVKIPTKFSCSSGITPFAL